MPIDPGVPEETIGAVKAREIETLGSPFSLTPTEAIVLLVEWHEDEVTTPEEAIVYAERLIQRLADAGFAITKHG